VVKVVMTIDSNELEQLLTNVMVVGEEGLDSSAAKCFLIV
jgi:hypothetical protein